jgi:hypothetical protein
MFIHSELMVCTDCVMVIANDDTSGIDSIQRERHVKRAVQALGGNVCLGDILKAESFSSKLCDCCGDLPGERFHVVILQEGNEGEG